MRGFVRSMPASNARSRGPGGLAFQKRAQFPGQRGVVSEGIFFGVRLEEEIERIDDRHFGHQIDFHARTAGPVRETPARAR